MQTRYTSADQWADAKDGVIPAPYALEEGEQIIDQYLEPVIFHNVNGPDIGVTTCGVIVKDGLYFKDLDNSGELAPYKDWRLSPEQRAEDMVKHLRLDQQAGLVLNTLFNSPVVPTRAEATNAEGKLELGKIYKHHNPGEKPMPGPLPGMTVSIDDSHVLEKHIAAGVYRGDRRCEAAMEALKAEKINKVSLIAFTRNDIGNAFWKEIGWTKRQDLNYYDFTLNEANITAFIQ